MSDYIKNLERQNEELQRRLAESEHMVEFYSKRNNIFYVYQHEVTYILEDNTEFIEIGECFNKVTLKNFISALNSLNKINSNTDNPLPITVEVDKNGKSLSDGKNIIKAAKIYVHCIRVDIKVNKKTSVWEVGWEMGKKKLKAKIKNKFQHFLRIKSNGLPTHYCKKVKIKNISPSYIDGYKNPKMNLSS